jgi:hypothetical protein
LRIKRHTLHKNPEEWEKLRDSVIHLKKLTDETYCYCAFVYLSVFLSSVIGAEDLPHTYHPHPPKKTRKKRA